MSIFGSSLESPSSACVRRYPYIASATYGSPKTLMVGATVPPAVGDDVPERSDRSIAPGLVHRSVYGVTCTASHTLPLSLIRKTN